MWKANAKIETKIITLSSGAQWEEMPQKLAKGRTSHVAFLVPEGITNCTDTDEWKPSCLRFFYHKIVFKNTVIERIFNPKNNMLETLRSCLRFIFITLLTFHAKNYLKYCTTIVILKWSY